MAMAQHAVALTYWVDGTCTGAKNMDAAITETKLMGEKVMNRLKSDSDTDFANVYEFLMKKPKSDATQLKSITDYMSAVKDMSKTDNRKAANLRIYCDQDARFKKRVDKETGAELGGWEDVDNWVMITDGDQGCLDVDDHGNLYTLAEHYEIHMPGEPPEQQEQNRASITFCNFHFFENSDPNRPRKGLLLSDIDKGKNLAQHSRFHIDKMPPQLSSTLIHEASHSPPYNTEDNAYLWVDEGQEDPTIQELTVEEVKENADVRKYIGMMAWLADFPPGYTMERKPVNPGENADAKDKKAYQDAMRKYNKGREKGWLFTYTDVTKRGLQRRLARLARRYQKTSL